MPSDSRVFLRRMVEELETPKVAQIFAYGKWLYPYRMQLHGAPDVYQRYLKMCRSADVAFLESCHQISLPLPQKSIPKPHFGETFNAKPIIERALRKLHVNGATKLKLYSYIGIDKYFSLCHNFSARGSPGGAGPPNVHL